MGFIDGFKRGYAGDADAFTYSYAGKQVVCSHCGGTDFDKSEAQLNTAGMTFLGLDWANRTADVLHCRNCGHLEWFL